MTHDQCRATTNTGFSVIRCEQRVGHADSHTTDQYSWPNVQPLQTKQHYTSNALEGVDRDNLIRDLFERIETLEQSTAGGAATDDMFAAQEQRIAQLEERVRGLERAQVYGSGQHDLSALQASIANHLNRALTDIGSGLDTRFTLLTEALRAGGRNAERRHIDTTAKLDAIWTVLGAMAPVIDALGWEEHPEECHGEVCFKSVPDGAQNERASGPPAAVQCDTRFREGQCSGWRGHHGDCAVVPDVWPPEDPDEFECGSNPVPGSSVPPCGRPKGHDGACVSGPSDENGGPFDGPDTQAPV